MRFTRLLGTQHVSLTVDVVAALADPTRWGIVELLSTQPLTVNELAAHFELTRTAVSRHLSVLRSAGVVTATKDGQSSIQELDRGLLVQLGAALTALAQSQAPLPFSPAAERALDGARAAVGNGGQGHDPADLLLSSALANARGRGASMVTVEDVRASARAVAGEGPPIPLPAPVPPADEPLRLIDELLSTAEQLRQQLTTSTL